ncbi:MAG: hypothetical protein JXN64_02615 [Spirochaetes bacterium]|nr:hypothetical protein [Spirochaetota bacterium]
MLKSRAHGAKLPMPHMEAALCEVCVPECIYRGFCPEIKSCSWIKSESYRLALDKYRHLVEI